MHRAAHKIIAVAVLVMPFHGNADDYQIRSLEPDYRIHCATQHPCSDKLAQLVTDKFKRHYDRNQYQLVVYSQFHPYTEGGGVGMAFAGVAPVIQGQSAIQLPIIRYTMSSRRDGAYLDKFEVQEAREQLAISAIKRLMDECTRRPRCDVYQPYNQTN